MSKKQEMNKTFPSLPHTLTWDVWAPSPPHCPHTPPLSRVHQLHPEPQGREFYKFHTAHHTYLFTHGVFLFPMMRHVCQLCWNWACQLSSLRDKMVTFLPLNSTVLLKLVHTVISFYSTGGCHPKPGRGALHVTTPALVPAPPGLETLYKTVF